MDKSSSSRTSSPSPRRQQHGCHHSGSSAKYQVKRRKLKAMEEAINKKIKILEAKKKVIDAELYYIEVKENIRRADYVDEREGRDSGLDSEPESIVEREERYWCYHS